MQPVGLLCWRPVLVCGVSDLVCAAGPKGVVADSGRGVLLAAGCISRRAYVTSPARSLAHLLPLFFSLPGAVGYTLKVQPRPDFDNTNSSEDLEGLR